MTNMTNTTNTVSTSVSNAVERHNARMSKIKAAAIREQAHSIRTANAMAVVSGGTLQPQLAQYSTAVEAAFAKALAR